MESDRGRKTPYLPKGRRGRGKGNFSPKDPESAFELRCHTPRNHLMRAKNRTIRGQIDLHRLVLPHPTPAAVSGDST